MLVGGLAIGVVWVVVALVNWLVTVVAISPMGLSIKKSIWFYL